MSHPRPKPLKPFVMRAMRPVKMWAVVDMNGGAFSFSIRRQDVKNWCWGKDRIARVIVREIAPKRRKR